MTRRSRSTAILVALEATPAVVAEAGHRGAQLLLTHHPLLYRPLAEVREDHPGGRLLAALIRARLAMVSCHTNLDIAPGGLNDYLAQKLELTGVEVLSPTTRDPWYKLAVFVPTGYEDRVRQALGDAGLGVIGRYSHCSFASPGQGTYRPLPGAQPFRGEVGAAFPGRGVPPGNPGPRVPAARGPGSPERDPPLRRSGLRSLSRAASRHPPGFGAHRRLARTAALFPGDRGG